MIKVQYQTTAEHYGRLACLLAGLGGPGDTSLWTEVMCYAGMAKVLGPQHTWPGPPSGGGPTVPLLLTTTQPMAGAITLQEASYHSYQGFAFLFCCLVCCVLCA